MRLELLQGLSGVVDESEPSALATTILRAETENRDLVLVGLVEVGQLIAELILGDVGAVGVEDIPVLRRQLDRRFFSSSIMHAARVDVIRGDPPCVVLGV